jgi:hypothetical protein
MHAITGVACLNSAISGVLAKSMTRHKAYGKRRATGSASGGASGSRKMDAV